VRIDGEDPAALGQASRCLAYGALLAFPTETVYGLGARADDDAAVAAIFAAKGRPREHPLIVHVADVEHAQVFAGAWPPLAQRLAAAFWPGPLTLIVPRREGIASAAAGGQPTIGLRCPAHRLAHALLIECARLGVPGVAAPSANRFGRISPTTAAHVIDEFGHSLADLNILDGGACEVGIESAIVDCSRSAPVLMRPGALAREALAAAAGQALAEPDAQAPRASGTLDAHYAPRATLRLMPSTALADALHVWVEARAAAQQGGRGVALAVYSRTVRMPREAGTLGLVSRTMPGSARAAAFELFAVLRELDALGVGLIWVEQPPPGSDWDGVRDRLERAAAGSAP
jgi:L-threonylcarbamoyladenylate synthase